MRISADDIPAWLAGLSDRALRRFSSRLNYLVQMIDVEMQRRECGNRSGFASNRATLEKTDHK